MSHENRANRVESPAETWLGTRLLTNEQGETMLGCLRLEIGLTGRAEARLWGELRFPEAPMPNDIAGFQKLTISYIDGQVMGLLEKMRPLLATVNCLSLDLDQDEKLPVAVRMLTQVYPLFGVVKHLQLPDFSIVSEFEHTLPQLLAKVECIDIQYLCRSHVPAICEWLMCPNGGQAPKKLLLLNAEGNDVGCDHNEDGSDDNKDGSIEEIVAKLKEQFSRSSRPNPYFVGFPLHFGSKEYNFKEYNSATGESLLISVSGAFLSSTIVCRLPARDVPPDVNVPEWMAAQYKPLFKEATDRMIDIRVEPKC